MPTFPRLIWVPLLCLALVAIACGAPDSTVAVSQEVVALRDVVPSMNDRVDVGSVVDLFAPMQMRVIGGNDATWKRDNPNWLPVLQLVSNDLKRDLQPALAEQAASNAARWDRELAAHLSTAQIEELLAFYRSDRGWRYLVFQKRLIAIQVEGSTDLMNAIASVGRDPKTVLESEPSSARVDARKKLITLSWLTLVTPQMGVAASPSHGASASDDNAMDDMLIEAIVKTRGPQLDALLDQYQTDLPAFSAFHASPMAQALLAVYGELAKDSAAEPAKAGADFAAALQKSIAQHTPAWRAAYEAGRTGAQ
jgi:hypothetical protein